MDAIDRLTATTGLLLREWRDQIAGTFLAPGSTFSIGALALSLVIFVMLAIPWRRRRGVRFKVLRRAILPRRMFRTASGRTDLAYFTGGILFAGLAVAWALVSAEQVRQVTAGLLRQAFGPAGAVSVPVWAGATIATAALFLAYEFAYWLDHSLQHRIPLLWHFHKVHHQAESLSIFTNGRVHPVDTIIFFNIVAVVTGVASALLQRLLGDAMSPFALGGTNLLVMATSITLTHLQHSHLWRDFGPLRGWLLGPAHHQIHHSTEPAHFNRNFGNSLTLFDRLFGTYCLPARKPATLRFGVDDSEAAPHGVRAALFQPFIGAARDIGGAATRAARFAVRRTGRTRGEGPALPA